MRTMIVTRNGQRPRFSVRVALKALRQLPGLHHVHPLILLYHLEPQFPSGAWHELPHTGGSGRRFVLNIDSINVMSAISRGSPLSLSTVVLPSHGLAFFQR